MAYDLDLADRLRETLAGEPGVVEKRMFGGLAFLVTGHLAVSAGQGGLLLRCDPGEADTLLADPRVTPFVMRGRELTGWLHVDVDESVSDEELSRWVQYGVDYARSLPRAPHSPVEPSTASRRRSAWPLCRAYSSIR